MNDFYGAGCCVASAWAVDMSPVGDESGWGLLGSCSYWIILSAIGDSHGKQANKKGRQASPFLCNERLKGWRAAARDQQHQKYH
jgi:hypothetical protein